MSVFSAGTAEAGEDTIPLKVETNTKFSVWVSFCEIYNENIHDLLEVAHGGALRRTALRLSQDVKGNAFVKGSSGGGGRSPTFELFEQRIWVPVHQTGRRKQIFVFNFNRNVSPQISGGFRLIVRRRRIR